MIDKQTVKFGDICKEVKLTTKDPIGDGYERYIGLEHLDSGSLKIKRWGMIAEDSPSFTRVFKKGQILFGKRRPYLKKAAIAEFDGICSGDIIVMESKLPELSSVLLSAIHTDSFWAWAVKNSAGGLSPRTKFKLLESYKLKIPGNVEGTSNLLEKAGEAIDKAYLSYCSADNLLYHSLKEIAGVNCRSIDDFIVNRKSWKVMKVRDCMEICNNHRNPISASERKKIQGIYPYYGPTGVLDYIDDFNFDGQYVLIGEDGDHFLKYRKMEMTQLLDGKFNVNNHAHVLRGTDLVATEWFYYFFLHTWIYKYLTRQGAGRYKLTKDALGAMDILVPPKNEQYQIITALKSMQTSKFALEKAVHENSKLAQQLRNDILGV